MSETFDGRIEFVVRVQACSAHEGNARLREIIAELKGMYDVRSAGGDECAPVKRRIEPPHIKHHGEHHRHRAA
jgi:hypothetical protein